MTNVREVVEALERILPAGEAAPRARGTARP
jgi:hypothetical protein